MDLEIQTLDDLQGFFVEQDKIVRIRFGPLPPGRWRPISLSVLSRRLLRQHPNHHPKLLQIRRIDLPMYPGAVSKRGAKVAAYRRSRPPPDTVALFIVTMANANPRPAAIFAR